MPRLAIFSAILATFSLAAASNGCNKGDGDAYENYRAATPTGGNKCAPTPVPVCEDLRADATLTASALYPTARVGSKHGGAKACTKDGGSAVVTESNGDLCVGAPPSSCGSLVSAISTSCAISVHSRHQKLATKSWQPKVGNASAAAQLL